MNNTSGTWKVGRPGTVVSDAKIDSDLGHGDTDYYGGYLIAESIANPDDAKLMAAAPDLFDVCKNLYEWAIRNDVKGPIFPQLEAAIKKATE